MLQCDIAAVGAKPPLRTLAVVLHEVGDPQPAQRSKAPRPPRSRQARRSSRASAHTARPWPAARAHPARSASTRRALFIALPPQPTTPPIAATSATSSSEHLDAQRPLGRLRPPVGRVSRESRSTPTGPRTRTTARPAGARSYKIASRCQRSGWNGCVTTSESQLALASRALCACRRRGQRGARVTRYLTLVGDHHEALRGCGAPRARGRPPPMSSLTCSLPPRPSESPALAAPASSEPVAAIMVPFGPCPTVPAGEGIPGAWLGPGSELEPTPVRARFPADVRSRWT